MPTGIIPIVDGTVSRAAGGANVRGGCDAVSFKTPCQREIVNRRPVSQASHPAAPLNRGLTLTHLLGNEGDPLVALVNVTTVQQAIALQAQVTVVLVTIVNSLALTAIHNSTLSFDTLQD